MKGRRASPAVRRPARPLEFSCRDRDNQRIQGFPHEWRRFCARPRGWTYLLGNLLGDGAYGAVFDCVGPFDQSFALKIFQPQDRPYQEVRTEWLREADRLYRLRHPNIVHVFDYFEQSGHFALVLERCDHALETMLTQPFTDRLVVEVMRQLLFAIQYLADNEIVHNDLHAGNVLMVQGHTLTCKLSDLGIAQEMYGQYAVRPDVVHHRIMAPEVLAGGYTTKQSDLYQLGLLLYQMHTGEQAPGLLRRLRRHRRADPPGLTPSQG